MIIDTSAVIALFAKEPESQRIAAALEASPRSSISAVSLLEVHLVLEGARFGLPAALVDEFLDRFRVSVIAFTPEHVPQARRAFELFGKGRHPARLNFGDCAAYATARLAGEPLLFVGDDFAETDVEPALG